ncbi:hypothetical protein BDZ89DRAFT_1075466 [Hymenopellis radicata]|nr:hypothetical protein BDZ89DRAFT_1075466 [Hymenopellis radicata]
MNITIIPTPPPAPVTDSAVQVPSRLYSGLQTLLLPLPPHHHLRHLHPPRLRPPLHLHHPHGHALSVFYASLIGGAVLLPPICITSEVAFQYTCRCIFPRYRESYISMLWMEYVPRALIIPVFLGGDALGLKILVGSPFNEARLVDKGHLVAASALGGFIFQMIYEVLRALIVMVTMSCCE